MKICNDFITNSSSSSFICEICGRDESGWDLCLSDIEMLQCEYGHTFCQSESKMEEGVVNDETLDKIAKNYNCYDDMLKYEIGNKFEYISEKILEDGGYDIPEEFCPICSGDFITNDLKLEYLLKIFNITNDELETQIKKIGNLKKIKQFISNYDSQKI